ncbi:MAG: hypothetical protein HQK53_16435 [Oligoflexia bacterium]|nr:hypothetical protein [Oligoflexia bacterium]
MKCHSLNFEETGLFERALVFDKEFIYMDEQHLNEIGSEYYSTKASAVIKNNGLANANFF